jgi:hypothetical protein
MEKYPHKRLVVSLLLDYEKRETADTDCGEDTTLKP